MVYTYGFIGLIFCFLFYIILIRGIKNITQQFDIKFYSLLFVFTVLFLFDISLSDPSRLFVLGYFLQLAKEEKLKNNETKQFFKILIVGVGNLGFRYLEGILNSDIDCEITLIESSETRLIELKTLITNYKFNQRIIYKYKIEKFEEDLDVCIISTSAQNRHLLIEQINKSVVVKNWIIEKVLAQSPFECDYINRTLLKKKAWVNLPRRVMFFYGVLKNFF